MIYYEKTLGTEQIYRGTIIDVERLTVKLPNGRVVTRDIVRNPGASAVVPLTDDGCIILVEQFRKPIEKTSLEIPAGKLDKGEDPTDCAKRELLEETGYTAGKLVKILTIHPTPAFADEILHIYLATDLSKGRACPDEDEFITARKYRISDVLKMIDDGVITDGKTVCGVLFAAGNAR
jgi:ADP-ribose pyrophosphatase